MIHRLVKLEFQPENTDTFLSILADFKEQIRKSPGCLHLEAWRDLNNPQIFFTYSRWEQEADLEAYRQSDTFQEVWSLTKVLFSAKPEAWSVQQIGA